MSTKSARRRKQQRAAAQLPQRTGVDLRKPAPTAPSRGVNLTKPRWIEPAGYQPLREAAAHAALYAGALGVHAPYAMWTGMSDGTATTVLADGTRLLYNPANPDVRLTAWAQCRHTQWHSRPVDHPARVQPFRDDTARCREHVTTIRGHAVIALHNKPTEYAA